jgi:hypothetical protein
VHLGLARPLGTDTVDQYDTPAYRGVCTRIADAVASEASAYASAGYSMLAVLGVEGSPSCGVSQVPVLEHGARVLRPGHGLFVQALATAFKGAGVPLPFIGVPEGPEAGDLEVVLGTIGETLGAKRARGHPARPPLTPGRHTA